MPPLAPSPEHQQLAAKVGTWDVECSYFMAPGAPPMKAAAVETVEGLGPFWTVSLFTADLGGFKIMGRATTGFDPLRKKFVGTWIDNGSPALCVFEGEYDAAGTALTMTGPGRHPATGQPAVFKSVETADGPDRRTLVFRVAGGGDAPDYELFRYEYRRRR